MKKVHRSKARHHLRRAESNFDGMGLLASDLSAYSPSVCLLAVHSAISFTDAVLIAYTGARSVDEDHRVSAKPLRELCRNARISDEGIKHLQWLLSRKTDFAYGDKTIDQDEVELATQTAERYEAWIYRSFPHIADEPSGD